MLLPRLSKTPNEEPAAERYANSGDKANARKAMIVLSFMRRGRSQHLQREKEQENEEKVRAKAAENGQAGRQAKAAANGAKEKAKAKEKPKKARAHP